MAVSPTDRAANADFGDAPQGLPPKIVATQNFINSLPSPLFDTSLGPNGKMSGAKVTMIMTMMNACAQFIPGSNLEAEMSAFQKAGDISQQMAALGNFVTSAICTNSTPPMFATSTFQTAQYRVNHDCDLQNAMVYLGTACDAAAYAGDVVRNAGTEESLEKYLGDDYQNLYPAVNSPKTGAASAYEAVNEIILSSSSRRELAIQKSVDKQCQLKN